MNTLHLKEKPLITLEKQNGHIPPFSLYYGYFQVIPNEKDIVNVDITAVRKWILVKLKEQIVKQYFVQQYVPEKKKNFYSVHSFILSSEILIYLIGSRIEIIYNPILETEAQELQDRMLKFQNKKKKTSSIRLITHSSSNRFTTTEIELKKPKIDFDLYYNDGFKEIHQQILKNLRKRNKQGLYLFHGEPGTGKSTYIKYIIQQQTKEVIFISPKIAGNLDDLTFTTFLLERKNCILVIEDAEELVVSRENKKNSGLSFLLNLTDGLLGESLGIQIIATFNTDVQNIDKALLRKGRLTTLYEFKKLSKTKTNTLLKKLSKDIQVNNEMSLADIFNIDQETYHHPKLQKAIGFGN